MNSSFTPNSLNEIVTAVNPCAGLHDGEGELAASQKAGLLAVDGDEVGLGQNLQQILGLQSLDHRAEIDVRAEEKKVQDVVDSLSGRKWRVLPLRLVNGLGAEAAVLAGSGSPDCIARRRWKEVDAHLSEGGAVDFGELYLAAKLPARRPGRKSAR